MARKTARRAMGLLVERGLVEVKPQRGVFVEPADNQGKPEGAVRTIRLRDSTDPEAAA